MFPLSAEKRMHREEEKINPVHVQQAGEAACPGVILKERQKKKRNGMRIREAKKQKHQ